MPDRDKPSPIPSLMPFVAIAVILLVIFFGLLLYPATRPSNAGPGCHAAGLLGCAPHR